MAVKVRKYHKKAVIISLMEFEKLKEQQKQSKPWLGSKLWELYSVEVFLWFLAYICLPLLWGSIYINEGLFVVCAIIRISYRVYKVCLKKLLFNYLKRV